jgi:thiazole synthase ThiGH ThiG subunit
MAVIAGRKAYEAKLAQQYKHAVASSADGVFAINSI